MLREVSDVTIPEIVQSLVELLTRRVVAYMVCHKDTSTVISWMEGETSPSCEEEEKLRLAYKIYINIKDAGDKEDVIRQWFMGGSLDPEGDLLQGKPVVQGLREGEYGNAERVAIDFIANG